MIEFFVGQPRIAWLGGSILWQSALDLIVVSVSPCSSVAMLRGRSLFHCPFARDSHQPGRWPATLPQPTSWIPRLGTGPLFIWYQPSFVAATDPWCWRGRLLELERTFAKFHNHAKVRVQPYRVPRAPTVDTTGAPASHSALLPRVYS